MLKFSMTSLALSGAVKLSVSLDGHTVTVQATAATLDGTVVLYATEISGDLQGTQVSFTPDNPPSSLPSDLQLTSLVAHRVIASGDTGQMSDLRTTLS